MNSPSMPYRAMIPATTTTNAPVGAYLKVRTTQSGYQEAGDNRAVDAGLRRNPGRDGERHRQRQRHQADRYAGDKVVSEQFEGIGAKRQD